MRHGAGLRSQQTVQKQKESMYKFDQEKRSVQKAWCYNNALKQCSSEGCELDMEQRGKYAAEKDAQSQAMC